MVRSIEETAAGLGEAGAAWKRLFGPSSRAFDALCEDILRPMLHVPRHPTALTRFGLPALAPATRAGAGAAGHARRRRSSPASPPTRFAPAEPADQLGASGWR